MMKRYLVIIAIVLIVGCNGNKDEPYPVTNKEFQKGTDGLTIEFVKSAPPDKILEENEFQISAKVTNAGAYDTEEAYLVAILENSYMCIIEGDTCVEIEEDPVESAIATLKAERTKLLLEREAVLNEIDYSLSIDPIQPPRVLEIDKRVAEISLEISDLETERQVLNEGITRDLVELDTAGFKGRSVLAPKGTLKIADFDARTKRLDLLAVQHTSPVILSACYSYITELTPTICIDPDLASSEPKVCSVEDLDFKDQGAPVAISKIETKMLLQKDIVRPQFIIHIENKGDGQVLDKDAVRSACSASKVVQDDWNRVTLAEFRLSNENYKYVKGEQNNIECSPNPLRLDSDQKYIRCTITDSDISRGTPSYTTQAYVKLVYGYTHSETKSVVIESLE